MGLRPLLLSLKQNKFFALLIILQVALTLAAVSHSVFSTTVLLKDWNVPSGLDDENLVYAGAQFFIQNPDRQSAIINDLQNLRSLPGVESVTTTNQTPFAAENVSSVFKASGDQAQRYLAAVFEMNSAALDVLGIELVAGRGFRDNEVVRAELSGTTEYPAVVMLSEALAEDMFGDESALGKTFWPVSNAQPAEIIGVYENIMTGERLNGIGKSYNSAIRPMVLWSANRFDPSYLIRTEPGAAPALLEDVRSALYTQRGRYLYINEVLTRTQKRMYDGRGSQSMVMLTISAVLILITGLGMAGLVSFLVRQRRKQIGIRRALGATKADILRYFLAENSLLTVVGLVLGIFITIAIALKFPALSGDGSLRYDLILMVAILLWLINVFAVFWPARRAANIQPASVIG